MRRLVSALLPILLLAGCAKDDPPADTTSTSPVTSSTLDVSTPLPEWTLGQGWTYAVERPGEATETFKMIVAQSRDDLWVVASDDRDQAINHAVYSTNPMLGRIGKETLSPFQSGEPVNMYQFPLVDGKTWTATFFGQTMNFRADYAGDIDASAINSARNLPKKVDGFRIVAEGGGMKVEYDYVEAVEWFTRFVVTESDGTKSIQLTLKDIESAFKGNFYFYRGARDSDSLIASKTVTNVAPASMGSQETLDANVPEGFDHLVALGVTYVGKAGTYPPSVTFILRNPEDSNALEQGFTGAREIHFLKDVTGVAGDWELQVTLQGSMTYEARVFGISKYAEGSI